ncbi:MAG: hypothetical protein ACK5ND_05460 [Bacteroides sp.]
MKKRTAITIFCLSTLLIAPAFIALIKEQAYGSCLVILVLLGLAIKGLRKLQND